MSLISMANNIALDIDHMLAFHMVKDIPQANFFHRKGAILSSTTLKTHYIYPGVIELIKVLFNEEFLNVSIFSKGITKRNREFVFLLLKKALPEPEYDDKRSQTRVFSRDALDGTKKNLITVLREGDVIENAALIDDRPENAASGQEYNLLQVPITDWEDFDRLTEKLEYYDATGTRFLKCVINLTGSCDLEENSVEEGRKIVHP